MKLRTDIIPLEEAIMLFNFLPSVMPTCQPC